MRNLVIVAHPDDETIWMGGLILRHPQTDWHLLSLSRADDPDRAPRFHRAAQELGADGCISDLDDSPVLAPLAPDLGEIKERISELAGKEFDLVFTHGARGEYTRHIRHEQVHQAVAEMMEKGNLSGELVCFAYEDRGGECTPQPAANAMILIQLTPEEAAKKRAIIKDIYGFGEDSFEYKSAGQIEAFGGCAERAKELLMF